MSNFTQFNLDQKILKALQELGYEEPTPVQALAIPKVLAGADLICSAQTGTGKTAAFMLPALQTLLNTPKSKSARVLILAPTRELALQITAVAEKYSKYLQMKTVCIYGGVPYPVQTKALSKPHDILVATPGRLLDHMQQGRIDLSSLKFLVLDEADRMLDMGFIEDVEKIAAESPEDRQTLLFSATLETKILRLSKKLQRNPEEVLLEPSQRENVNIEQRLFYVDGMGHKMRLLDHILANTEIEQAIIFIATRNAADTLAEELHDKGYVTEALHGNMSQRQRTRTIGRLRRGDINILVATDVAARGIDVRTLSHVINIDLPFQAEDYIHRIGRTGRAGGKGVAITFATYKEEHAISKINQTMGSPMTVHTIEGFEPSAKSKGAYSQRGPREPRRFGGNKFNNRREERSTEGEGPRKFGREFNNKKRDFTPYAKREDRPSDGTEPRKFGREFNNKKRDFTPFAKREDRPSDGTEPRKFGREFNNKKRDFVPFAKREDGEGPRKFGNKFNNTKKDFVPYAKREDGEGPRKFGSNFKPKNKDFMQFSKRKKKNQAPDSLATAP